MTDFTCYMKQIYPKLKIFDRPGARGKRDRPFAYKPFINDIHSTRKNQISLERPSGGKFFKWVCVCIRWNNLCDESEELLLLNPANSRGCVNSK